MISRQLTQRPRNAMKGHYMTNPFAPTAAAEKVAAAEPATEKVAAPASTKKTEDKPSAGFGDPFASPSGVGDGERITDFIDRLLLIKPTEYIPKMATSKGETDAVRIDMAVLDDSEEPGRVVAGVLLFQQALKREARTVLDGPQLYLLGRLRVGETRTGNTLYTFDAAEEDEADMARKFLKVRTL